LEKKIERQKIGWKFDSHWYCHSGHAFIISTFEAGYQGHGFK